MRKGVYVLPFLTIIFLLSSTKSFALTSTINVNTEANGGQASSTVHQTIQSNSTNTSSNTSRTDIHMETNGEVKDYHSEGDDDVTINSGNGNNSVSIQNKGSVKGAKTEPTITVTPGPTTVEPTIEIATSPATPNNIFQEIKKIIEEQFNSLRKLFHFS
jgi:hypothetical protein